MSAKDDEYFEQVEAETGTTLEPAQRRWYVATREADFSGSEEKMWQEYPSTPKEAFQVSTEGKYYAVQMTAARKAGRIGRGPMRPEERRVGKEGGSKCRSRWAPEP